MDSGKFLVLPFVLFMVAIGVLYRALPRSGRVADITFAASGVAVITGTALTFSGFDWGSYRQSFDGAEIGVGGGIQVVGTLVLTMALLGVGTILTHRSVLPWWLAVLLPMGSFTYFWLTPTSVVPGIAWLVIGVGLLRCRQVESP